MATLEEHLDALQEQEIPRIELETHPQVVRAYHYDTLEVGRRAAYVIRHSHIREDREHIRDFEYVIFPQDALEKVIRSAMAGLPKTITCKAKRILHTEHVLYGERIAGTGETVDPVNLAVKADIRSNAVSLDIHYI
ncbi:MAG: hypothetical protein ABIJ21_01180 [Nanoarchaeota archaeon]